MADLLDSNAMAQFEAAMRDVTDTFYRYPVRVELSGGAVHGLVAGIKEITAELKAAEGGEEISRAYRLRFGRAYLMEKGLVDGFGKLLLDYDAVFWVDEQRFVVAGLSEPVVFRHRKLVVLVEVVR